MHGGTLIRQARLRAGLTQAELATRMGTHQSVVGRWESRATSPSLEIVTAAVAACGLQLELRLQQPDPDLDRVLQQQLRRSPAQRIASAVNLGRLLSA